MWILNVEIRRKNMGQNRGGKQKNAKKDIVLHFAHLLNFKKTLKAINWYAYL